MNIPPLEELLENARKQREKEQRKSIVPNLVVALSLAIVLAGVLLWLHPILPGQPDAISLYIVQTSGWFHLP